MAWVDVTQHEGETAEEARRRRRYELARGWRFKCECSKCLAEEGELADKETEETLGVDSDESKVEGTVERLERGEAVEASIEKHERRRNLTGPSSDTD